MTRDNGWILATDLDGTFLGGSAAERQRFYRWLSDQDSCTLIFVTGREVENTLPLLDSPIDGEPVIPRPHYIIADIGTEILDGHTLEPVEPIQDWVATSWGNANDRVQAMLEDEQSIRPQAVEARYRVSYYFDPEDHPVGPIDKVRSAGFDCLLSHERYLDVLPRGVSKGPALLRLLEHCGLRHRPVVVAGDTLNDLSLFETGLAGIAVGHAEDGLIAAVQDMAHVYRSPYPGVTGIWDGLHAHGLCDIHPLPRPKTDPGRSGQACPLPTRKS